MIVVSRGYPKPEYNIILTVMGPQIVRTKEIMGDLERKTELKTKPAPEFLLKAFDVLKATFSQTQ